jgi:hypothetical protein
MWCHARVMSVLPPKADIDQRIEHVCFVPIADLTATPHHTQGSLIVTTRKMRLTFTSGGSL